MFPKVLRSIQKYTSLTKRCIFALQRDGLPPVTTHNVVDDWSDPVLNSVRRCQMFNTVHDKVKVGGTCRLGYSKRYLMGPK